MSLTAYNAGAQTTYSVVYLEKFALAETAGYSGLVTYAVVQVYWQSRPQDEVVGKEDFHWPLAASRGEICEYEF
jgi:hypothetical protein